LLYNVLLVDDEPMIREGLRTLIDWEGHGFRVVGTAANGKEALQKFGVERPDLLIIDIRMPGMSGLEVIEELRKQGETVHVVILSGYADFDYAKKAITFQIDGYLLKPVDEDELTDYLKDLRIKLSRESEARQMASVIGEWTREAVIQSLLPGGGKGAHRYEESKAAEAGLIWDHYDLVLIKLIGRTGEIESELAARMKRMLARLFEDAGRGAVFSIEPYIGLLLKEKLHNEQARKNIHKEIASLVGQHGIEFAAASGGETKELASIGKCYEEASRLIQHRFFYEGDQILTPETESLVQAGDAQPDDAEPLELAAVTDKLFFAVDIGNFEAIAQLVSYTGRRMVQGGCSEQDIKSHFAQIVTGVLGKLALADPEVQSRSRQYSSGIIDIYKQSPYSSLERYIVRFLHGFIQGTASVGTDKQMKKMIDLIQRNYQENLKLEALADVFNYNSAYLGKLFKNTTGEYFNTYLDKVRIEKAKQLLEQGMKVYQVAEKVGYTNVDYFHSKFRKYVGTSPSSYRKKETSE